MSTLYYESELYHHGVKGMKWGRRRYQNADGSLTPAGIKRYATKGYTQDSYNSNKSKVGKAYDKVTGAHKTGGQMMYNLSTDKQRKARAEKYLAENPSKTTIREAGKNARNAYKEAYAESANNSGAKMVGKKNPMIVAHPDRKSKMEARSAGREAMKDSLKNDKQQKDNSPEAVAARRKKAIKVGAAVAGTALAVYGAKKVKDYVDSEHSKIAKGWVDKAIAREGGWRPELNNVIDTYENYSFKRKAKNVYDHKKADIRSAVRRR